MKNKIAVLLTLVLSMIFHKINAQSENLEESILTIVKAFKDKDYKILNEHIHSEYGLHIIYKRGAFPEYQKTNAIDFSEPIPEYLPYFSFKSDYSIKYESLPEFDFDNNEWSKYGLYCDTLVTDHLLSETAKSLIKLKEENMSKEKLKWFEELENSSYKVWLMDQDEGELIFYLTFIDNKWYLTILDRASTDQSA